MRNFTIYLYLLFFSGGFIYGQSFEGGSGTEADPWQVATPAQLNLLRNYLAVYMGESHIDKHFVLVNDIDLSSYLAAGGEGYTMWGDAGWLPIGNWTSHFQGSFDGKGFSIKGLKINRPDEEHVGRFRVIDKNTIKNIHIVDMDVLGNNKVGGLVGLIYFNGASIVNSSAKGVISGGTVGLLVGENQGTIESSYSEGTVLATSTNGGGLVGTNNHGNIFNSHSSATVNGVGSDTMGGLVGYNQNGIINYCYATGNVSGAGRVGGLIGYSWRGQIDFCFTSGDVTSTSTYCGGISGDTYTAIISNSYALGIVKAPTDLKGQYTGGIFGNTSNESTITKTYATGKITGSTYNTGGITGCNYQNSQVAYSYWDKVTTTQTKAVGVEFDTSTSTELIDLPTASMKGSSAATNMSFLDFTTIWETVEASDPDATADGYPILKGISRTAQLKAQNLLAKYNLSLNASPEAGGTLSGGGLVEVGDKVTLSATAATGYQFVNWTDDAENNLSTEASFIYTMPASDVSLTANFELIDYQLTLSAAPEAGGTVSGAGTYNMGETVEVSASPASGYRFVSWTDTENTLISSAATFSSAMPASDVSLTANFELIDYQLTLSAAPEAGGTVSGAGTYNMGETVSLSATAATGYQFVSWTDAAENILSTEASFIYTMPASDVSLTANFDILTSLNDKEATKIQVWPNPFEAEILISGGTDIKQVTLVTLLGETIFKTDYSVSNIQTSQLSPGVYILKIEDNDGRISSYTLIKK
jgi:uncharacterized repeat protein (TIGR02543 family)